MQKRYFRKNYRNIYLYKYIKIYATIRQRI